MCEVGCGLWSVGWKESRCDSDVITVATRRSSLSRCQVQRGCLSSVLSHPFPPSHTHLCKALAKTEPLEVSKATFNKNKEDLLSKRSYDIKYVKFSRPLKRGCLPNCTEAARTRNIKVLIV